MVKVKSTLYTTAKVLPGNRIEIESPELTVGQTVEVVILVEEVSSDSSTSEYISPMPRRNATGVVCKFLIWGVDDVCMVLLSGQPLTVMSAGLLSSLVLIVVFLVVHDRSERKVNC